MAFPILSSYIITNGQRHTSPHPPAMPPPAARTPAPANPARTPRTHPKIENRKPRNRALRSIFSLPSPPPALGVVVVGYSTACIRNTQHAPPSPPPIHRTPFNVQSLTDFSVSAWVFQMVFLLVAACRCCCCCCCTTAVSGVRYDGHCGLQRTGTCREHPARK